jgi:hypothetical protein
MRRFLLLFLVAFPLFATGPSARPAFPDDYVPSPCAPSAEEMCGGVKKVDFAQLAHTFRGLTIDHAWIDAHWDEMKNEILAPLCRKMASCYTMRGNTTVWCQDLFRDDFVRTCNRYEEGSEDRTQCEKFTTVYFTTLSVKTDLFKRAQACAERSGEWSCDRLEVWVTPAVVRVDDNTPITVHAIDAKRRIPIRARVSVDEGGLLEATESPAPTTALPSTWQRRLKRVPNADGHTDVVAPILTVEADGYQPAQVAIPVEIPTLTVTMTPPADQLRAGKQTVTISARDAKSGAPIEMRVMAGDSVAGRTNEPFELTITGARPEIWLTSLFHHYSDVVVVKAN